MASRPRSVSVPLSVLDLAPIVEGGDARRALLNTVDLGQHAERWGYRRIWFAEHHNMPGVASAATALVIGQVAAATSTIRVGAGGIMLPNHSPLVIAEQFGTLATLFPGRIDLGLGRAPGTDGRTAVALRRNLERGVESFPHDVVELMGYFRDSTPQERAVRAVPGAGTNVPLWILGSSLYGAEVAAALGLPFAFASHFAPAALDQALATYRKLFRPSAALAHPQVMLGVNVIAADTDEEAALLATSLKQAFLQLRRGRPGPLPAPVKDFDEQLGPDEQALLDEILSCSFIGSPDRVRRGLEQFLERTGAGEQDELILAAHVHDHAARLRSYEIASTLWR
jgi:luciferase family oxidoreductase group 1